MAKIGLNFGDKMTIGGKSYRVIEGLNLPDVLGHLTFRKVEGPDVVYEDDLTQPRRQDGTYPQVSTGEVRGVVVGIHSKTQHETLFITIVDMTESEIDALGLNFRDEVVLQDVVVTFSSVNGRDNYKIFASKLAKKGQAPKQPENKGGKGDKE